MSIETIDNIQVFDHHLGEIIVELIGSDERGEITVVSISCGQSGSGVARLPQDMDEAVRDVVVQALREQEFEVRSDSEQSQAR